jgi:hypothetical protein
VIDFSKAAALHRLYGHDIYMTEMAKAEKSKTFVQQVCSHVSCLDKPVLQPVYSDAPVNYRSAI